MSIKLVVTDMDGTLLQKDHTLSDYTINALIEIQKAGIKLCLASGRSVRTLEGFGKALKMDENKGYYVCVNGAKLTYADTLNTTVLNQLSAEDIKEIMDFVASFEVEVMAVQDAAIYDYIPESVMALKKAYRLEKGIADDVPFTAGTFDLIVDQRKGYDLIEYINKAEEIKFAANKMCIAHEPAIIAKVHEALSDHFKGRFNFAKTSPRWLEVAPQGIDKAAAISRIMSEMQIDNSEVIVFGDGENDLSMFGVSKYAYAMANAMDSVKRQAYKVTEEDNNHDGMVKALQMHILQSML